MTRLQGGNIEKQDIEHHTIMFPIRLTPSEYEKWKEFAKDRGEPLSIIVRRAVRLYMSNSLSVGGNPAVDPETMKSIKQIDKLVSSLKQALLT